ncbi:TolC family protein [Chitinophaga horti]|uniref:TolC family protein n=1 Tax=Chitinophaga horti TaxID=2920382 RepID=A0ABY6J721_9BACT|nr:TolC family protein [Chitinophaga horti]UYQ94067.1 TolC family protein [Chitinophaga horti]
MRYRKFILSTAFLLLTKGLFAQVLTVKDALETALTNYNSIKAKAAYANASRASVNQARKEALPNFVLSAQQDYGTVNGQNGPAYGFGGYGVASSGLPLAEQNWNAAFGALYLANLNWDFYTFGKVRERIATAERIAERDASDRDQEQFQHQVRVVSAYLNLLAAQRLTRSQENNLARADTFRLVVATKARNGLIAGVDSSLANAEVSNARIALIRAKDVEQDRANQLSLLMGIPPQQQFTLDTLFITRIPGNVVSADSVSAQHPLLQFYTNRLRVSQEQEHYFRTLKYPNFTLFSVIQTRASGFSHLYATDQTAYNHKYWEGVKPSRSNYLFGVGVTWNLTGILRAGQQVTAQHQVSEGMRYEAELVNQQLQAQQDLAGVKMKNALAAYNEAPLQVRSSSDAFTQRSVLYRNGLNTIVDVTQALYTLNRAETDRDIAFANVWQALLLKAASTGNLSIFTNEF